jgi:exonuclease SbcD
MRANDARVLLLADTHLGFDLPSRPRVNRRRRGHDFFANFERALQPALHGEVDLVVHGGDLFYRSKLPVALIEMAMEPLVRVADHGIPVYLVPGNHERARIPLHLWTAHPNIHIFDRPRTYLCELEKGSVAISGFPHTRKVRDRFATLVNQTRHTEVRSTARLLCLHQAVEGAQVGTGNYTFRSGPDVIWGMEIPGGFSAVLAGHIHRAQVLSHDMGRRLLAAPVIYPGSVERTSFAERDEDKGYMVLTVGLEGRDRGRLTDVSFIQLPTRPMVSLVVEPVKVAQMSLSDHLQSRLAALDPDSIVRVQFRGPGAAHAYEELNTSRLRGLAPSSMNISLSAQPVDGPVPSGRVSHGS